MNRNGNKWKEWEGKREKGKEEKMGALVGFFAVWQLFWVISPSSTGGEKEETSSRHTSPLPNLLLKNLSRVTPASLVLLRQLAFPLSLSTIFGSYFKQDSKREKLLLLFSLSFFPSNFHLPFPSIPFILFSLPFPLFPLPFCYTDNASRQPPRGIYNSFLIYLISRMLEELLSVFSFWIQEK